MFINADIGENAGDDAAIIPTIDIGNIACGYHASDLAHMEETVLHCIAHNVKISAHPGYDDRENFGRISVPHTAEEIVNLVEDQVLSLLTICNQHQTNLFAIKPHGALYHDMMNKLPVRDALISVAKKYSLPLIVQARKADLAPHHWSTQIYQEVFADRRYTPKGNLLPRSEPDSLLQNIDQILTQATQLIEDNYVRSIKETICHFKADTICFHGDNPASAAALKRLHATD